MLIGISSLALALSNPFIAHGKLIKAIAPPPSARVVGKDPVAAVSASQIALLDPTGIRSKLISRDHLDRICVGDILLVRQKNGDPFSGVCINIRRRGVDSGILLRNQLTRMGVEMWYKIYSPNVEGIEVVQRRKKRARRARLYYLRKKKHDMGSVEGVVRQYLQQKRGTLDHRGGGTVSSSKAGKKGRR